MLSQTTFGATLLFNMEQLLENERVVPGDPACSQVIQRMHHEDPALIMPPGPGLSDAEICAVQKWIEQGAAR